MNFFEQQLTEKERREGLALFRVWAIHKEHYRLMPLEDGVEPLGAVLKGAAFYKNAGFQEYPAVGDIVAAWENPAGESVIHRVLERKSQFVRLTAGSIGAHSDNTARQLVAANFDTVFLMESLNQDFNVRKMERYLVTARESGGMPVVVLTKADLCGNAEEKVREMEKVAAGVPVLAVSAKDGTGMERLKSYVQPGRVIAVTGSSGIGKSTLINTLAGKEVMATSEIRESDDRGRHTTTHRQIIRLENGAMMIDTPGMRQLGLWSSGEGIETSFEDILELAGQCRFSDCRHEKEPGCAVQAAVETGKLLPGRLAGFKKLEREAKRSAAREALRKKNRKK
ncbi:MAG: ribosome small subunit-dependent GTPase A [Lachnospiraceae bacterium]|nr:ribosome small subunit-dependent GTPase A [Lachnospiraceae bacterium]